MNDIHNYTVSGIVMYMDWSVREAADALGVSERRVRAMIADHVLPARKISGSWIIESEDLQKPRRLSRPLSLRMAWALAVWPAQASWASSSERYRLRHKVIRLNEDSAAVALLASWLADRAHPIRFSAPEPDAMYDDARLVRSGISDPRSRMSGINEYEFYVQPGCFSEVVADHLLVESKSGRVVLRQSPIQLSNPVPLLLVAADLADNGSPRDIAQAKLLIEQVEV